VGRRPVMLGGLAIYTLGALGCALATSVDALIVFRFISGLAGGVGMVLTRAIVRDLLEGAAAQRLLSHVMVMFGLAPAIAPILGGWMFELFGWRSIFWFLFVGGLALTVWSFIALPESHPQSKRQSLHPIALAKGYFEIFRSPTFYALAAIPAFSFQIFIQYIGAAHPFLVDQLELDETQFGYLFVPVVVGFMLGSFISGRTAGKWSYAKTIWIAHLLMIAPALFSVIWHAIAAPNIFASIGPLLIATAGIAMATPITQVLIMELMPARRGLAASCQAFTQLLGSAITLGIVSIALSGSTLTLAFGHLGWALLSLGGWVVYLATNRARGKG
jgi:MFS transporter, DHA1 family, multidrug resistance protein